MRRMCVKSAVVVLLVVLLSCCCVVECQQQQNCYQECSADWQCGNESGPDCKYCVEGRCSCAPGMLPCQADSYAGPWTPYRCYNTSTEYCSSNAGHQPISPSCGTNTSCIQNYNCEGAHYPCCCLGNCGNQCSETGSECVFVDYYPNFVCQCLSGYTGNGAQCTDINECANNASICGVGMTCENTAGSYSCNDIDECANNKSLCDTGRICQNTVGSYNCNSTRSYFIVNAQSRLVMTASATLGDAVLMMNAKMANFSDQLWSYVPADGGYLQNNLYGYVMDIQYGNVNPGAQVIVWDKKTTTWSFNQMWGYNSTLKTFTSKAASTVVLDVQGASTAANTPVIIWSAKPSSQNANQQFQLVESTATQ